jgi:hypothetical protein
MSDKKKPSGNDNARRRLSATYGKNGLPELRAVPCLVIVVGPMTTVETGEAPCRCPTCTYKQKHTGHA